MVLASEECSSLCVREPVSEWVLGRAGCVSAAQVGDLTAVWKRRVEFAWFTRPAVLTKGLNRHFAFRCCNRFDVRRGHGCGEEAWEEPRAGWHHPRSCHAGRSGDHNDCVGTCVSGIGVGAQRKGAIDDCCRSGGEARGTQLSFANALLRDRYTDVYII